MASKPEILKAVELLVSIYGTEPETLEGFYIALDDIEPEYLTGAVRACVKESPWLPKPADLRKIALALRSQQVEEEKPGKIFWATQALFNLWFSGKITDEQFFSDKLTKMMIRLGKWDFDRPETPEEAAIRVKSDAEVEAWMIADYGSNWRDLTEGEWQSLEAARMEASRREWSAKMQPYRVELEAKLGREPGPFEVDQLFLERYYAEAPVSQTGEVTP